jgi:hypothetical protein
MIILRWILGKYDWVDWTGMIWLRIETSGGSYEHGDEPLVPVECLEILEQLSDWRFLKKNTAAWS